MLLTSPEHLLIHILYPMVLVEFIEHGIMSLDELCCHLVEVDFMREVDFTSVEHVLS